MQRKFRNSANKSFNLIIGQIESDFRDIRAFQ